MICNAGGRRQWSCVHGKGEQVLPALRSEFLQAPAVKIPTSLQLPEALVTWRSICTLGTERNLVLCCKSCLLYSKQWKALVMLQGGWMCRGAHRHPVTSTGTAWESSVSKRNQGVDLQLLTDTPSIHWHSLGVICEQEKPGCRFPQLSELP